MTSYPRKIARAMLTRARIAAREFRAGRRAPFGVTKFEDRAPGHVNAIDVFAGRWATDLSTFDPTWRSGEAKLLADPRPGLAARYLGSEGTLEGMIVLELGPLEGAHTYLLEQLGAARIVAIEANREAYLKCLIVKEALGISRATFMLGDFALFLRDTTERFDLVFCCGVLYHMEDPLSLIRDMARVTERCFVWTHYYDPGRASDREAAPAAVDGFSATYFGARYWDRAEGSFWGGTKPTASWMTRDDLLAAFRHFGFDEIDVIADQVDVQPGPAITFAARKTPKADARALPRGTRLAAEMGTRKDASRCFPLSQAELHHLWGDLMKLAKFVWTLSAILALVCTTALPPAAAEEANKAQLDALRKAMEKYQDYKVAVRDLYLSTVGCIHYSGEKIPDHMVYAKGAMGVHFVNLTVKGPPDPMKPNVLIYEPVGKQLKLVAVEWLVPLMPDTKEAPTLFGQKFMGPMEGHEPLIPKEFVHYDLHAWLFKNNPLGMFEATNPKVNCKGYEYELLEKPTRMVHGSH